MAAEILTLSGSCSRHPGCYCALESPPCSSFRRCFLSLPCHPSVAANLERYAPVRRGADPNPWYVNMSGARSRQRRSNKAASNWPEGVISRGSVCDSVIFVCPEFAPLLGFVLETLLLRSIGIADLEKQLLLANRLSMVLLDDLIAFLSGTKPMPGTIVSGASKIEYLSSGYSPSKTDSLAMTLSIADDTARLHLILVEDGRQLLKKRGTMSCWVAKLS